MSDACRFLTLGQVADHFTARHPHCLLQAHHVRRLFTRRLLPEPPRLYHQRVIAVADLPKVEQALISAGYITPEGERRGE